MKFQPGQEVVCTTKNWWNCGSGQRSTGPKYNELVTVIRYHTEGRDDFERSCIYVVGWTRAYHDANFEPVLTNGQLNEELQAIETITKEI